MERKDLRSGHRDRKHRSFRGGSQKDPQVTEAIKKAENELLDSLKPVSIKNLNAFQRKMVHQYFEKTKEYQTKTYREGEDMTLKVYPVGKLKRLAEQLAQEVIMNGESRDLPAMGSFERYVLHDYLKNRDGIKTESEGEGVERHIVIHPIFGRIPKKAKRRLS